MMPELDGYSLCKKLKSDIRTSHIPIILLTALSDQNSKLDGLAMGADAYLSKPFNTKELFVRIDKLIALRKSLQQHYHSIISDKKLVQPSTTDNKEDTFINKVRLILEKNLADEDFGINQLCKTLAMSRSQLYRKFSSLTDLTVHQFIMTLKLKKAQELLLSSDLNVSEVAFDTGFKNISHFSRVFTKEFGYNPSSIKTEKQS
jgi:YesN/AraC family two-component response regulator